ncbi:MAG: protein translocase subunit SecD [Candidatus Latescibacteria bacterium]|nr:protein translocase subunit SecD [Candidatus Latescibacterota bacterium]
MQWKQSRLILILVVTFTALWYVYPSARLVAHHNNIMLLSDEDVAALEDRAINLGLDLVGGVYVALEVDKTDLPEDEARDVIERAMQVISNRVNEFGVAEPIIQQEGEDRIIVELPGIQDVNRALSLIQQTAQLEFKMLRDGLELNTFIDRTDALVANRDTSSTDSLGAQLFSDATATNPLSSLIDVNGSEFVASAIDTGRVNAILRRPDVQALLPPEGQIASGVVEDNQLGQRVQSYYYMNSLPEMTGASLEDAYPETGSTQDISNVGLAQVGFTTTDDGAREFARITGANIGRRMAIILDGRVFSAPTIQSRIPNGSGVITGIGSLEEARDLSIVLRAGALPAPMTIIDKQVVGPSLGRDAISSGQTASILGLITVLFFMYGYYRTSGLLANFALALNLLFLLGVLAGFQATLTLPGIAGIILTMGMSVDANILIFERIKEEIRSGKKTIRQSIDSGYGNAIRTIIDANITTLITALALYQFGTGPIKGFALTLSFGIVISMFTAITVTRALYDRLTDRWNVEKLSIGKADPFGKVNFGFMRFGKAAFIITWTVILIGLVTIGARGGLKWGVDFQGGSLLEVSFNPPVPVQDIRNALGAVDLDGTIVDLTQSEIKEFGSEGNVLIRSAGEDWDEQQVATAVKAALVTKFPESLKGGESNWLRREGNVSPKIGKELTVDALGAVMWSIIGIVIYIAIRFRHVGGFRFGIGAITALVHDVLIVIAAFSIISEDITMAVVAALLTVVGYSTNDTIVVFDRIREGLGRSRKEGFSTVVDTCINECLNRTMMTSITVLLVLAFLLAGSQSTNFGFALALTFGVITGTYSSIFVASPIVVWWHDWVTSKREKMRKSRGSKKKPSRARSASGKQNDKVAGGTAAG